VDGDTLLDALIRFFGEANTMGIITGAVIGLASFRLFAGITIGALRAAGKDAAAARVSEILEATDSVATFLNPFSAFAARKLRGHK